MAKSTQKIQHLWSLICERAVIDSKSNNVSLTNVLEDVQVSPSSEMELGAIRDEKNLIVIPMNFNLVSTFRKLNNLEYSGEFRVIILDPNNRELNVNVHPFKIPARNNRYRTVAFIQGFPITIPGEYKFLIQVKENGQKAFMKLGEILLDVKIVLPPVSKRK